jgi:hypothetical protein
LQHASLVDASAAIRAVGYPVSSPGAAVGTRKIGGALLRMRSHAYRDKRTVGVTWRQPA